MARGGKSDSVAHLGLLLLAMLAVAHGEQLSRTIEHNTSLQDFIRQRIEGLPKRGLFDGRALVERVREENKIEALSSVKDVAEYKGDSDEDKQLIFLSIEQRSGFLISAIILLAITAVLLIGAAVYSWKRYKVWQDHMKSMHELRMTVKQEKFEMCQYMQTMESRYINLGALQKGQLQQVLQQIKNADDFKVDPAISGAQKHLPTIYERVFTECSIRRDAPVDGKNEAVCMVEKMDKYAKQLYKSDAAKQQMVIKALSGLLLANRMEVFFGNAKSIPEVFREFIGNQCEKQQLSYSNPNPDDMYRLAQTRSTKAFKDMVMSMVSIVLLGAAAGYSPSLGGALSESAAKGVDLTLEGMNAVVKYADPANRVVNAMSVITAGLTITHVVLTIIGSAVTPFISVALAALSLYKAISAYYKDVEIARWQLEYTKHVYKEERYDFSYLFCRTLARVKTLERQQQNLLDTLQSTYLTNTDEGTLRGMLENVCTAENAALCYQMMSNPQYQALFGPPPLWLAYAAKHGPITDLAVSWNTRMDAVLIANGYQRVPQNIQGGDTGRMAIYAWYRRSFGKSYIGDIIGCDTRQCATEKEAEGYVLIDLNLTSDPGSKTETYMLYKRTSVEDEAIYDFEILATKKAPHSDKDCPSSGDIRSGYHAYCYFRNVRKYRMVSQLDNSSYFDFSQGKGSLRMYVAYSRPNRSNRVLTPSAVAAFLANQKDEAVAFIGSDSMRLNQEFRAAIDGMAVDVGPVTSIRHAKRIGELDMPVLQSLTLDFFRPIDSSMKWWVRRNPDITNALSPRCKKRSTDPDDSECAIQEVIVASGGVRSDNIQGKIRQGYTTVRSVVDPTKSVSFKTSTGSKYKIMYKPFVARSKEGLWLSDLTFQVSDDNVHTSMVGRAFTPLVSPATGSKRVAQAIINEDTLNRVGESSTYSEDNSALQYAMYGMFSRPWASRVGQEGAGDKLVKKMTNDADVSTRLCDNSSNIPDTARCVFVDDHSDDAYDPAGILSYNPITNFMVQALKRSGRQVRGRPSLTPTVGTDSVEDIVSLGVNAERAWHTTDFNDVLETVVRDRNPKTQRAKFDEFLDIEGRKEFARGIMGVIQDKILDMERNFITGFTARNKVMFKYADTSRNADRNIGTFEITSGRHATHKLAFQYGLGRPIIDIDVTVTPVETSDFSFQTENPTIKESLSEAFKLNKKYQTQSNVLYSNVFQTQLFDKDGGKWRLASFRIKKTRRLPFMRSQMCGSD